MTRIEPQQAPPPPQKKKPQQNKQTNKLNKKSNPFSVPLLNDCIKKYPIIVIEMLYIFKHIKMDQQNL